MVDPAMVKLRQGDVVTFKARVTRVSDYDGGQQIMATILPKGAYIGWCLPQENAFYPDELTLSVGDMVKCNDRPGHKEGWEVMAIFDNGQIAIKKSADALVELASAKNLRRIS